MRGLANLDYGKKILIANNLKEEFKNIEIKESAGLTCKRRISSSQQNQLSRVGGVIFCWLLVSKIRFLAQPSGNLVQDNHPESHSPWYVQEREGHDCQDWAVCCWVQLQFSSFLLDGNRWFNLGKGQTTLSKNFWDGTLVFCGIPTPHYQNSY